MRTAFGTHGFTAHSPRGITRIGYGELTSMAVGPKSVIYRLRAHPLARISPRELFPDMALALVAPHVKIRRRDQAR